MQVRFDYTPIRTAAPTALPVPLAAVKAHLQVEHDEYDDLIEGYLEAACTRLDGWAGILGRCLVTQTWAQSYDRFCTLMRLPMPAASAAVTYLDPNGASQTLSSSAYALRRDALGSFIERKLGQSWPSCSPEREAVTITFTAGYGPATDKDGCAALPKPIRSAILLIVADLYANRETSGPGLNSSFAMSPSVPALLRPYRLRRV